MSAKRIKQPSSEGSARDLLGVLRPVLGPLVAFSCVINLLISTGPLFLLQVVDQVLPSGNLSTLIALTIIALMALAVMSLLEYFRGIMMVRAAAWWERDATRRLLPLTPDTTQSVSRVVRNISRVANFLANSPLQSLLDAPWAVLFFVLVYVVHPTLAAVGIMIALLLVGLALAGHLFGRAGMEQVASARLQANGLATHLDQNRSLLATMGIATNLFRLQHEFLTKSHRDQKPIGEADHARHAFAKFLRTSLQILVVGTGAWLVLNDELSGGAMIACSILLARALGPIEHLTGSLPAFVDVRMALQELDDLKSSQRTEIGTIDLPTVSGELACENLTVAIAQGRSPVLHKVNARFSGGQCVAIMGGSGAGKTTLVNLLTGSETPTIGSVKIDGCDLKQLSSAQRARTIGFLPQRPTLFPGTVAENISRFQPDADQQDIINAAVAAGSHSMILGLPDGYATRVASDDNQLSGGERQRIALARALFQSPRILVLDEPNAALDREGERALISALSNQKAMGVTIIIVAHRASVLGVVDKILLLDSGRVRDFGSKGEVIARMNARMRQIDLEREPAEASRLEDWITSHFKREGDTEARSTAAMVAMEMFNISLASDRHDDVQQPIRFTLKHTRGMCTISMLDTCELIASARIDRLKRIADDELFIAPALEGPDLALLMVMQLADSLDQKAADHGRVIQANIATPIRDEDEIMASKALN